MISVGVDTHKALHVAVALDQFGRELSVWQGGNSEPEWSRFSAWLEQLGAERQVGIEGAWSYGRGLAQRLVERGEQVYEVNARWTAAGRRTARQRDKSDHHDAHQVALFVHRESAQLTAIVSDDETSLLDLLTTEREATLNESRRLKNQLHVQLHHLDPDYRQTIPSLKTKSGLRAVCAYEAGDRDALGKARAASVRRLAVRLELALSQAAELEEQIARITEARFAPLTKLCGISLLTAGTLAGILGPGQRFASDAALAAYAGVAPLETSSAGRVRHRVNRGGNRRLNAVLYRIAVTQTSHSEEARAYIARRMQEGKTKREAMRALKRYLARAVWRLWTECWEQHEEAPLAAIA